MGVIQTWEVDPAAQQIGRINFIENVKSGGNLLTVKF